MLIPVVSRCQVFVGAFLTLMVLALFAVVTMVGAAQVGWDPNLPLLSTAVLMAWTIYDKYHPVPNKALVWYE